MAKVWCGLVYITILCKPDPKRLASVRSALAQNLQNNNAGFGPKLRTLQPVFSSMAIFSNWGLFGPTLARKNTQAWGPNKPRMASLSVAGRPSHQPQKPHCHMGGFLGCGTASALCQVRGGKAEEEKVGLGCNSRAAC